MSGDQASTQRPIAPPSELRWSQGNYPYMSTFRAERAGPFGCDPCWDCGQRPGDGQTVWQNNYGDLYCDPCAHRRADRDTEPEVAAELER